MFWSISNHRFITGQWVKLSRTSMTCMGVIPQRCLQRHYTDLNCVLLKIHPCCDTNRKSSAVINLVVSSLCLLICWPVWSHCYLVLALFVSSIDLSALNFYYKVFNITIKRKQNANTMGLRGCQFWLKVLPVLPSPICLSHCDTPPFSSQQHNSSTAVL